MKLTRTLVSLALSLLLLLSVAVAEAPVISDIKYAGGSWGAPFDHTEWKPLVSFNLSENAAVTATLHINGSSETFNIPQSASGEAVTDLEVQAGDVTLYWPGADFEGWHPGPGDYEFTVKFTAAGMGGTTEYAYEFPFHYAHDITQHQNVVIKTDAPWMWQNTVCSFGPHFRNIDPELTDKWYMFSAIDLSQDGVQTYELVAGGRYKIGNVTITVNGDEVTVDYDYFNDLYIYNQGEFFTFFPDFDSITTVDPAELTAMEYGKTYSIANDLNGDTNVLLYICNMVNFQTDIDGIERFYENIPWRKELRQSMLELAGLTE